jgi:CDP-paratose 2-epimerase
MQKVLVTGGAGFIGCHIAKHHIQEGAAVIVLDNLSRKGSEANLCWLADQGRFSFLQIDVENGGEVRGVFDKNPDIGIVYHMAAQVAVTTSVSDPKRDFETNLLGTFNLLEAIRGSACRPVVLFASTNKVYGPMADVDLVETATHYEYLQLKNGIAEEQPLDFYSPYACSKGAAEQYIKDYSRVYGLRSVIFRQSCVYGPRQLGVEDQGWVAWFVNAALSGHAITVYGNGKQTRDLLFVDDLVEGYRRAIDRIDKVSGEVFNIGGGKENQISVLELLELLADQLGKKINYSFGDWRPGDQKLFVCDIRKAWRELEWRPETHFLRGIKRLIRAMQDDGIVDRMDRKDDRLRLRTPS